MITIKKFVTISLLIMTYVIAAGNEGCTFYQGDVELRNLRIPMYPQSIPGMEIPANGSTILDSTPLLTLPLQFPLTDFLPGLSALDKVSEIYLETIAIRSERSDDKGEDGYNDKQLKDRTLVGDCGPGQKPIDFLDSIEIYIQKNDSDEPAVLIAKHKFTDKTKCGFIIDNNDPTPFNLKKFLPSFTITNTVVGKIPSETIKLTGYMSINILQKNIAVGTEGAE